MEETTENEVAAPGDVSFSNGEMFSSSYSAGVLSGVNESGASASDSLGRLDLPHPEVLHRREEEAMSSARTGEGPLPPARRGVEMAQSHDHDHLRQQRGADARAAATRSSGDEVPRRPQRPTGEMLTGPRAAGKRDHEQNLYSAAKNAKIRPRVRRKPSLPKMVAPVAPCAGGGSSGAPFGGGRSSPRPAQSPRPFRTEIRPKTPIEQNAVSSGPRTVEDLDVVELWSSSASSASVEEVEDVSSRSLLAMIPVPPPHHADSHPHVVPHPATRTYLGTTSRSTSTYAVEIPVGKNNYINPPGVSVLSPSALRNPPGGLRYPESPAGVPVLNFPKALPTVNFENSPLLSRGSAAYHPPNGKSPPNGKTSGRGTSAVLLPLPNSAEEEGPRKFLDPKSCRSAGTCHSADGRRPNHGSTTGCFRNSPWAEP